MIRSWSDLIAAALAAFAAKHNAAKISERLDVVYGSEQGRVDSAVSRAQHRVLEQSEW